ncbi:MAG TPA: hypothetical protein VIF62_30450 [Labilithrix sp.]|jgi:hypothetical protein
MLRRTSCVLAVCAMFAACDSASSTTQETDAGTPRDGDASTVACPTTAPAEGEGCALPEGTTCDFGACSTRLAQCTRGHWQYGGNPPPNPPCPTQVPLPMSKCPDCWPAEGQCTYHEADCFSGDASNQQIIVATCEAQVWAFAFRPCPVQDAGADVQGDAEPDGD